MIGKIDLVEHLGMFRSVNWVIKFGSLVNLSD